MDRFMTYNNTLKELAIVRERKQYLMDKREELWSRFCSPQSTKYGEVMGTGSGKSKPELYVEAITTPDAVTHMTIDEELEVLSGKENRLNRVLKKMAESMFDLDDIETMLYCEIVINGNKPTRAVSIVAETKYITEQAIWKSHYPKVKEIIKEIKK